MYVRLGLAILLPFVALALQWLLWPWLSPFVWFLFFPAVFFSARIGGLWGGLASTLLSIVIVWFFFIPPQLSWTINNPNNAYSVVMFLIMGYLFSESQERLRLAQQKTENRLTEVETRFKATFEQASVGIALVSPDGHWLQVNRKLCEIVGYSQEELLPLTFQDITHPDDLNTDLAFVRQMLAGEIPTYSMEKRYFRKDGRMIWISLTVALTRKADTTPDYFIAVIEDISSRKLIEETLKASEHSYQSLFENTLEGIAHCRMIYEEGKLPDFIYLEVNDAFGNLTGLRDVTGKRVSEVIPGIQQSSPELFEIYGRVAKGGVPETFETFVPALKIWFSLSVYNTEENCFAAIFENITERKRIEGEILRLNANLEQRVIERTAELIAANRELDSFAYAVSHDLRGPLRAMSGFSKAIIEDYGNQLQGEAKTYLDQIEIASHKMAELIEGILVLSRSTRGELHRDPIDISALATTLLEELAHAEPERKVAWQVEQNLRATGDARMIEAVMRNLLSNAWKYTGKSPAPMIRVSASELNGQHEFCVADNGSGFDMAHSGRLFKPFQRLHRQDEFPGLGIGLATVQRIIHRHGGTLRAEGKPGAGATFCFTLPTQTSKEDL
jgi:PAS domain S-box-containing protein